MSAITEAGGNITPYLERAMTAIRGLGVNVAAPQQSPVLAILERIKDYDEGKVLSIAATLQQSSTFNDIVRTQLSGMEISARYADIASGFDSIRDDANDSTSRLATARASFLEASCFEAT